MARIMSLTFYEFDFLDALKYDTSLCHICVVPEILHFGISDFLLGIAAMDHANEVAAC